MPVDYKNSKIYCIRSHTTDNIYIGSTTQTLSKRFAAHKSRYKRFLKGKSKYMTSYELVRHEDAYIELICACPCDNKDELQREEGKHIRSSRCVNKHVAGRTPSEYYQDNYTKICKQIKDYYVNNRDYLMIKKRIKYKCPCGGCYTYSNKAQHMKTKKHIKFNMENNRL